METVSCIFEDQTDGYTCSCQSLVAVASSHEQAETMLLEHVAHMEGLHSLREKYEDDCLALRTKLYAVHDLPHSSAYAEAVKVYESDRNKLYEEYNKASGGVELMTPDIAKYTIRDIPLNKVILNQ